MIQDILPQKLYNTFVRKEPLPDSRILSFRGGQAYYRERDGEIMFLSFRRVNEYYEEKGQELPEAVFLFSVDTQDYFLMDFDCYYYYLNLIYLIQLQLLHFYLDNMIGILSLFLFRCHLYHKKFYK